MHRCCRMLSLTLALSAPLAGAADIPLANASVVVQQAALDIDPANRKADGDLRMLRWAADDLAEYLGRITGGDISVGSKPAEGTVPVYVGNAPNPPDMTVTSEFGDAYLVDISAERVALAGESARAVYYAAARLLHRCGVRWYGKGELGEVVPDNPNLALPAGRTETTPDFRTRNLWADKRWALRNGLGGPAMAQGHAFARHVGQFSAKENPEYFPIINGNVVKHQANLSNPDVVDIFVNGLRESLTGGTNWAGDGVAIGPDDGALLDERPESIAMDSGRTDPFLQLRSSTDRFIRFCNKVAGRLEDEFPDRYYGFYVYSNHNLPPQTVHPHRQLFPIVAPITYNRYTSVGNPTAPTMSFLESVVKAWAEQAPRLGVYLYNYNLADTAMPFTRTRTWALSFPRLHRWGVRYATIESMDDNWHFQVPGNYILGQLLWDADADVEALLNEFYPLYYGPAAAAMRRYNETLETAYETTDAYAGSLWSMHRILTPETLAVLHEALDEAERLADAELVRKRVRIARFSLTFADQYLSARAALNDGRLRDAAEAAAGFKRNYDAGRKAFPNYIGKRAWGYFRAYFHHAYEEAGRIAEGGRVLGAFPDAWRGFLDKNDVGVKDRFYAPGRDVSDWIDMRTHTVSLDEQGFPFYRGAIWYRTTFELPKAGRDAERLHIWFGGIDDTARVWLNNQELGAFGKGRMRPVDVDITDAVNRDGVNTVAVRVSNEGITELGTGGIMRPVFLHAPYEDGDAQTATKQDDKPKPLFGGDVQ